MSCCVRACLPSSLPSLPSGLPDPTSLALGMSLTWACPLLLMMGSLVSAENLLSWVVSVAWLGGLSYSPLSTSVDPCDVLVVLPLNLADQFPGLLPVPYPIAGRSYRSSVPTLVAGGITMLISGGAVVGVHVLSELPLLSRASCGSVVRRLPNSARQSRQRDC